MDSTAWPASTCSVSALGSQAENSVNDSTRRVCEAREQQRFVAPDDFNERRARPVRARRDMPDERRRLERHAGGERPEDDQPLARLQIERNLDGELAVCLELLLEIGRRHEHLL